MARQAGIDPRAVRAAALARLPDPPRSPGTLLRGGPTVREHTLRLPGRLPGDRDRSLARALSRAVGADGTLEDDGPDFRWAEDHTQGRTSISVEEADGPGGGVRVTLHADRRGWAALLNVAGLVAGIAAGAVALPLSGSAALAVAAGLVAWRGSVRLIWRPYAAGLARRMEAALVEVVAHLEEPDDFRAPR